MKTEIRSSDPVKTYGEALVFLSTAVDALDQAHAALRDVNMHHAIATRFWGQYASLLDAVAMVDKLLEDAREARCEECGELVAGNERCLRGECHLPEVDTLT